MNVWVPELNYLTCTNLNPSNQVRELMGELLRNPNSVTLVGCQSAGYSSIGPVVQFLWAVHSSLPSFGIQGCTDRSADIPS